MQKAKSSPTKSPFKATLQRKNTIQRKHEADVIRHVNEEVHKYSDAQKFKREHPEVAYKNVKSKVAGNMKSISKA